MHTPHLRTSEPEPPCFFYGAFGPLRDPHLSAWTHGVSSRAQFDIGDIAIFVWSLGGLRTPCFTAIIPIPSCG
jgi:hypothetical protein